MIEISEPHRAVRRRHADRRHEPDVGRRHQRPDRPQRCRQDHVLQRAQRIRPPGARHGHRVRRRPAGDVRLPARALGPAANVPDRAGDRQPVGVRERVDRARALGRAGVDAAQRRDRRRSSSSGSGAGSATGQHARRRPSGGWSRSPGRWSASRGWSCSTSRRPGFPTTRRPRSARSSGRSPTAPARSTILVDHDMELVGATCTHVAVLDFGHIIADGPTAEVLHNPKVMAAYLGTEEVGS